MDGLKSGDEVFLAFATVADSSGSPYVSVRKTRCLDAENRVFRCDQGIVTVMQTWSAETWHRTEAAAWRHCANVLRAKAGGVMLKADDCSQKAEAAVAAEEVVSV